MNPKDVREISRNIIAMEQLALLKANLLRVVDELLTNGEVQREEIAYDLLNQIEQLSLIEDKAAKKHRCTSFMMLHEYCDQISEEQDKKIALTIGQ